MENNTSPIPIWVIVIIIIIVLSIILFAIFYTRKRSKRTRSNSIETIHRPLEEEEEEKKKQPTKKSESLNSFQTLVHQQKRPKDDIIPKVPSIIKQEILEEKKSDIINESDYVIHPTTPEPEQQQLQEIKISLPLPPPSTSFFSDKMELEDNQASQDLYQKYLKPNTTKEFVSIDLESNNNNNNSSSSSTSFYAAAATNISQKAATIKSSLYQSFRLQQKPARATAQNMFAPVATPPSPTKVVEKSKQHQPSPPPPQQQQQQQQKETISYLTENQSQITMDSNKTIIHIKEPSFVDTKPIEEDNSIILEEEDDTMNEQEPVRAAKRIIRSASRKTKTRSMVVNHDSLPAELQQFATVKVPKNNGSMRFGSIRGAPRTSGEHMTITSGSMRRMVRESVYFADDQEIPSIPAVSAAAAAASTRTSSRKSGGVSAVDIAGWWGGSNNNQQSDQNKPKTTTTKTTTSPTSVTATAPLEEDLDDPLFKNVSAGSNSSNSPNQYRASLSTSIFGTMSKSSMALFIEQQGQPQEQAMTRRESFRKGTLSRNTLRNLTAGAKDVNRSIKGLFDHASSGNNNSNKVVPDDSQKMELDSSDQQENDNRFQSIRQKSVRNNSGRNSRPSLPVTYIPESSPKYALGDEEQLEDVPASPRVVTESPIKKSKDVSKGTLGKSSHGEVDTIRRMLQDTWNMKESGSMFSISSEADSVVSSQPSQQNKSISGRHQSSSLLTKSLLTSQVAQRNSMLRNSTDDFLQQGGGPQPTASFSSSTARTMILDEVPTTTRQKNGSNKVQQQDDLFSNRFSTATMEALPRNSSADSSRGHSRKSSGGNSAATALRISSGYSINARTWNGRANQKRQSRPSVTQVMDEQEQQAVEDEVEDEMPPMFESIGPNSTVNKRAFFSTMRKGQKSRGGIPWMDNKTPAQIERDRYLDGGKY